MLEFFKFAWVLLRDIVYFILRKKNGIKKKEWQEEINRKSKVREKLALTLAELDANRAYVYLFHNGGRFYNGESNKKASCDIEIVKDDIGYMEEKQNIPFSFFGGLFKHLLNTDFSFTDCTSPQLKPEVFIARNHHTKYLAIYVLKARVFSSTRYYGLVCIDWTKKQKPDPEVVGEKLKLLAASLADDYIT